MQINHQQLVHEDTAIRCSHFTINLNLAMRKQNVLLIDLEVTEGLIAIFGYISIGSAAVNQIIFPDPILPSVLLKMPEIKQLLDTHHQYAVYNKGFEAEILKLPPNRCIELMPYPKCSKERFIQIESLTKISAAHLPDYKVKNIPLIAKHNLSCLIKELMIFLLHHLLSNNLWSQTYLEMIAHGIA